MSQHITLAEIRAAIDPVLATHKDVTDISKASPAVVTATSHGYLSGDYIILTAPSVDAAAGLAVYKITKTGTHTFTIPYDNSGGTGGAQTAEARKITAGLVALMKPNSLRAAVDALSRKQHVEDTDGASGAAESTLDDIFPAGGNNP